MILLMCLAALYIYIWLGIMAVKFTWGLIKVLLTVVFSPLLFIFLLIGGITKLALVVLVVMAIVALFNKFKVA